MDFAASEHENNIKKISKIFKKKYYFISSRVKQSYWGGISKCKDAKKSRIQIVAPSSNIHLKYSINITKKQLIKDVRQSISKARELFEDIQFTAQDAPRAENTKELIDVTTGATTTLPTRLDTAPEEYSILIAEIKNILENLKSFYISTLS